MLSIVLSAFAAVLIVSLAFYRRSWRRNAHAPAQQASIRQMAIAHCGITAGMLAFYFWGASMIEVDGEIATSLFGSVLTVSFVLLSFGLALNGTPIYAESKE